MRRSKTLLLIAAASLAIPMVATVNAQAGSTLCPASRVCIYVDNDYIGLLGYRSAGGGIVNVSAGANDKMSSYENKSATHARWYHDANGGGKCVNMSAMTEDNAVSWNDNNDLSSWATNGGC